MLPKKTDDGVYRDRPLKVALDDTIHTSFVAESMNYWTNLFTPEPFEAFSRSDQTVSGFRKTQQGMANRVQVGDKLICYMVHMSRWIGVLEVVEVHSLMTPQASLLTTIPS